MTAVLRGHLARRLDLCSPDELRVIARILERLELGRQRYGSLDLQLQRPWRLELSEELLDAVVYDTIEQIRAEDLRHEDERAELLRWQADDQRTRVSDASQAIAATPEAVPEPVVEWEAGEGPHARRGKR